MPARQPACLLLGSESQDSIEVEEIFEVKLSKALGRRLYERASFPRIVPCTNRDRSH